jgi:hypothetical protein
VHEEITEKRLEARRFQSPQPLPAVAQVDVAQQPDAQQARLRLLRPRDLVEVARLGKSLEWHRPPVHEGQAGDGSGQFLHDPGDEDLAAGGGGGDAGGGVHRLAEEVSAFIGDLAGVEADPDPELLPGVVPVVPGEPALDGHRAGQRGADRGKGEHEAVAQGLDLSPAVPATWSRTMISWARRTSPAASSPRRVLSEVDASTSVKRMVWMSREGTARPPPCQPADGGATLLPAPRPVNASERAGTCSDSRLR